jgi:plasmid stabilization system protein ParE
MTRTRTVFLEVSEEAAQAIINQALYYREQSPDSALEARWDEAVMLAVISLLHMPERGAECRFKSPGLRGIRRIAVKGFPKHSVFYLFSAEQYVVHIVDVIHGARDLETLFGAIST